MRKEIPRYITERCLDPTCMCKGEGVRLSKVHRVAPDEFNALLEESLARPFVEIDQARAIADRTVFPDNSPLIDFMINWRPYGDS